MISKNKLLSRLAYWKANKLLSVACTELTSALHWRGDREFIKLLMQSRLARSLLLVAASSSGGCLHTHCFNNDHQKFVTRCFHRESASQNSFATLANARSFQGPGGLEIGVCVAQGIRNYQEDRWLCLLEKSMNVPEEDIGLLRKGLQYVFFGWWFWHWFEVANCVSTLPETINVLPETSILAVFDGHGGSAASHFVMQHFETCFNGDIARALQTCDARFRSHIRNNGHVGTTAIVCQFKTWGKGWDIATGNVGDSRAILVQDGQIVSLSKDHSPATNQEEMDRLTTTGAVVSRGGFALQAIAWLRGISLCPRVYHPKTGEGGLNMSRAIGDDCLKPYVIPDAEITHHETCGKNDFVIIASDGLWEVLSNSEAANIVSDVRKQFQFSSEGNISMLAAVELVQRAQRIGTTDNVTVIVARMVGPNT